MDDEQKDSGVKLTAEAMRLLPLLAKMMGIKESTVVQVLILDAAREYGVEPHATSTAGEPNGVR